MRVDSIDHFVLTVRDIGATCDFYSRVLSMQVEESESGPTALKFGRQKINVHQAGKEFELNAAEPTPGSYGIRLYSDMKLEALPQV